MNGNSYGDADIDVFFFQRIQQNSKAGKYTACMIPEILIMKLDPLVLTMSK